VKEWILLCFGRKLIFSKAGLRLHGGCKGHFIEHECYFGRELNGTCRFPELAIVLKWDREKAVLCIHT
jgi:hypothetical protein